MQLGSLDNIIMGVLLCLLIFHLIFLHFLFRIYFSAVVIVVVVGLLDLCFAITE